MRDVARGDTTTVIVSAGNGGCDASGASRGAPVGFVFAMTALAMTLLARARRKS